MGLAGTTTSSSILHIKMSEETTETGPPVRHPSIFLIKREFTKKMHSFVSFTNNFCKIDFFQNGLIDLSTQILYKQDSVVSLTGMLVKNETSS